MSTSEDQLRGVHNLDRGPSLALRDNAGKAPLVTELAWFNWDYLADHCAAGRLKYPDVDGKPNWTLGGKPDAEYLNAAGRHLQALGRGEEIDPETGTHHAAAVQWNMGALLTMNRDAT